MSASSQRAGVGVPAPGSGVQVRLKLAGRRVLSPVVRAAQALGLTPNTVTVIGLAVVLVAAALVAQGLLLFGAAVLLVGSLLDAVDGSLARASGGSTPFGGFLDSTLDRVAEATVYSAIAVYFLANLAAPTLPVVGVLVALGGSFMVSYSRARAEAIGADAEIGFAQRTERLVLIIAGLALAGLGWGIALIGAMWIIGLLALATVLQRIWHVWRQTGASERLTTDEHREEAGEHRG